MEYTGIIHAHSTYSYDAKLSLIELKSFLVERGIHFVCMTEHVDLMTPESAEKFVAECRALSDSSFLFIPGFEVPYKHVLMVGMTEFFKNYTKTIEELREWSERAKFVILAHPVRNQFLVDDGLLGEIDALEVWNQQYEGKRVPRTRSLNLLHELRLKKQFLLGTGGVDFHRSEHMGGPFVTLEAGELTTEAIISKLTTGAFRVHSPHASFYGTIPDIDAQIKKHRLESILSVCVITLGKFVNRIFAHFGLSLPKGLKQLIRKRL
jgi:predicted metal-dependent phosphoesterase TrpH